MLTPEKLREIEEAGGGIELPNGEWHKRPSDLDELALFLADPAPPRPDGAELQPPSTVTLARMFHRSPAADADALAVTGLRLEAGGGYSRPARPGWERDEGAHPAELREIGKPEQQGDEAVLPPAAVGLIDGRGLDPHRFVHAKEGKDAPEDTVMVLGQVAAPEDEDLTAVEVPGRGSATGGCTGHAAGTCRSA